MSETTASRYQVELWASDGWYHVIDTMYPRSTNGPFNRGSYVHKRNALKRAAELALADAEATEVQS